MIKLFKKSSGLRSVLAFFIVFSFVFTSCSAFQPEEEGSRSSKTKNTAVKKKKHDRKKDSAAEKKDKKAEKKQEEKEEVPRNFNSVLLGGDILLEEDLLDFMDDYGTDYPLEKIEKDLRGYDIFFANLETPIGEEGKPVRNKPYVFMINPGYAVPVKKMNPDVVSIANNHIMDYGDAGLFSTIDWLDSCGIQHTGAGKNSAEARKPVIIKRKGVEFVFLAYNERPPESFNAGKKKAGAASSDINVIAADIKKYKKKTNIVLVSMHWGIEHTLYPQTYQTELAHQIINAGADGIIGHHPHWIQGIEIYKEKPIFYSLGNLLNGFYNTIEQDNFLAVLRYRGVKLRWVEIIPVAGHNTLTDFQPYVMKGDAAREHLENIKKISSKFKPNFVIKKDKGYIYIIK